MLAGCALVCCVLHFDLLGGGPGAGGLPDPDPEIWIADTYTLTPERTRTCWSRSGPSIKRWLPTNPMFGEMEARRSFTWSEDETPNTAYTGLNLTYTLAAPDRPLVLLLITGPTGPARDCQIICWTQFVNSDTVKARRLHLDDDFWTVSGGLVH